MLRSNKKTRVFIPFLRIFKAYFSIAYSLTAVDSLCKNQHIEVMFKTFRFRERDRSEICSHRLKTTSLVAPQPTSSRGDSFIFSGLALEKGWRATCIHQHHHGPTNSYYRHFLFLTWPAEYNWWVHADWICAEPGRQHSAGSTTSRLATRGCAAGRCGAASAGTATGISRAGSGAQPGTAASSSRLLG